MWPGDGRLTFPLSIMAKTPRPTVTNPIKRTLEPKSEIVIAASHGKANTKSQREANASLPRTEDSSAPPRERDFPLHCSGEALRYLCSVTGYLLRYIERIHSIKDHAISTPGSPSSARVR